MDLRHSGVRQTTAESEIQLASLIQAKLQPDTVHPDTIAPGYNDENLGFLEIQLTHHSNNFTRYNCTRIQGYNGDTGAKPREIQPDTIAPGCNCNRMQLQPDTIATREVFFAPGYSAPGYS